MGRPPPAYVSGVSSLAPVTHGSDGTALAAPPRRCFPLRSVRPGQGAQVRALLAPGEERARLVSTFDLAEHRPALHAGVVPHQRGGRDGPGPGRSEPTPRCRSFGVVQVEARNSAGTACPSWGRCHPRRSRCPGTPSWVASSAAGTALGAGGRLKRLPFESALTNRPASVDRPSK